MTKIIAFAGKKQSGKSTSAEFVERLYLDKFILGNVKIYSFADPLKRDVCINILGLTYKQCYGSDEDKNTPTKLKWVDMPGWGTDQYPWPVKNHIEAQRFMTAREVMEFVGTGIFRRMYEDVWVDATLKLIDKDRPAIALINDLRFGANEGAAVKNRGGIIIKLERNPFNSQAMSERGLDPDQCDQSIFDCIIPGELSIEDRNNMIRKFLQGKL
jgi:hypothetical protein